MHIYACTYKKKISKHSKLLIICGWSQSYAFSHYSLYFLEALLWFRKSNKWNLWRGKKETIDSQWVWPTGTVAKWEIITGQLCFPQDSGGRMEMPWGCGPLDTIPDKKRQNHKTVGIEASRKHGKESSFLHFIPWARHLWECDPRPLHCALWVSRETHIRI